nr:hypothetical protein CFP56_45610 [Quercus suber]
MSIKEFPSPPRTWKGKEKKGESVWIDPATALGRMQNVISEDEFKALSLVPSHELISRHIHKLVQVLGESLCMKTDYLATEKLVMANSRAEAKKAESSKLRKDLIEAMGEANDAKTKLKEVSDELRTKKMLVIQKDEEIQYAMLKLNSECFELLRQWTMKYPAEFDYFNIEFEAIDKEIMTDEAAKQA